MTSKSKYSGVVIALGATLGAVFGVMAGNMGAWLAIGVALGVALSSAYRGKSKDCPQCAELHRAHAPKEEA
jgi:hypothetical protein